MTTLRHVRSLASIAALALLAACATVQPYKDTKDRSAEFTQEAEQAEAAYRQCLDQQVAASRAASGTPAERADAVAAACEPLLARYEASITQSIVVLAVGPEAQARARERAQLHVRSFRHNVRLDLAERLGGAADSTATAKARH